MVSESSKYVTPGVPEAIVYVVCTHPSAPTMSVCRGTFDHVSVTVEPGDQPGPESTATTVPLGPEVGLIVAVAAMFMVSHIEIPLVPPVPVSVWVPQVVTRVTVADSDPAGSVLKLCNPPPSTVHDT